MQKPLQITQRGLDLPEDALMHIRRRAEELDQFDSRITSCHVVCEAPHHHQSTGVNYLVRVSVGAPGRTLVAGHQDQTDLNAAIRDAFDAVRRELEDAVRERDGRVKAHHSGMTTGSIARLFSNDGYGFIRDAEDREFYFHRNSVLNQGFDKLTEGVKVRFAEEMGEKGPQASTVAIAGRS